LQFNSQFKGKANQTVNSEELVIKEDKTDLNRVKQSECK
jgi:hypothetical protein